MQDPARGRDAIIRLGILAHAPSGGVKFEPLWRDDLADGRGPRAGPRRPILARALPPCRPPPPKAHARPWRLWPRCFPLPPDGVPRGEGNRVPAARDGARPRARVAYVAQPCPQRPRVARAVPWQAGGGGGAGDTRLLAEGVACCRL